MNRSRVPGTMLLAGLTATLACLSSGAVPSWAQPAGVTVLEDFKNPDGDGFPKEWKAQRNETSARQSYRIQSENGQSFLAARKADQRVYKKVAWDPKAKPIVTWRWRLKSAPSGTDPIAAVFVSLDTDLLVIPVATKYVWSGTKAKGTVTEGGLFDATEIVLRTGPQPVGEWVEERVNAYEDFKRIHKHEPAEQAWGISLLGGAGVEIDFGPIAVSAP
ncbi:MAG TPA: DUF3047 domain-containing protein [Nitrospiraceae bacterium]|jgi:hypothetical protein|nr:DUF3047 domain-containing protein [Nitrospiraceae bacterium]